MKLLIMVFIFSLCACASNRERQPSQDLTSNDSAQEEVAKQRAYYQEQGLSDSLAVIEEIRLRAERELREARFWEVGKKGKLNKVVTRLREVSNNPDRLFEFKLEEFEAQVNSATAKEKSDCQVDKNEHIWWSSFCIKNNRSKAKYAKEFSGSLADYYSALSSDYDTSSVNLLTFLGTTNAPALPSSAITPTQENYLINKIIELQKLAKENHQLAMQNKSTCKEYCFHLRN